MSEDQNNFSAVQMDVDNFALGSNTSNIVNNYFPSSSQTPSSNEPLPNFPNQVLEALTTVKKFLARQKNPYEIRITKEEVKINERTIYVNYEACKICKVQHGNLICSQCQRKVCANCITKRDKNQQCLRCKGAKKTKEKTDSEFEDKIEKLFKLENDDKILVVVQVELENLGGKTLEELIEVVKKLEVKRDKLDRAISIVYFYVGKIFYERMEEFFIEDNLGGKEKLRKILGSFRSARELDFGGEKMSIREIKEKLNVDDNKISRFFGSTLKIYLTYRNFGSAEEQIRKAEKVPAITWLRDLSQEKFLDFLGKLGQRKEEEEEEEL